MSAPSIYTVRHYWAVGFSLSLALAFGAGLSGLGLWIGLSAGLITNGALMLGRLHRRFWKSARNWRVSPLSRPL